MSMTEGEFTRRTALETLSKTHRMPGYWAKHHIDTGTSIEEARGHILRDLESRSSSNVIPFQNPAGFLGLTRTEMRKYSLFNAIRSQCRGDTELSLKGRGAGSFEAELSQEISKRSKRESRGLFVPYDVMLGDNHSGTPSLFARALTASGGVASGGALVQNTVMASEYIPPNYSQPVVISAGARLLSGLQGTVLIPKLTTGKSGTWVTPENTAVAPADATFAQVALSPKDYGTVADISRRLLLQANPAVEGIVRDDVAMAIALGLDQAALVGTGASGQPLGVSGQAGVTTLSLGTNGGPLTWSAITYLPQAVGAANRLTGPVAFIGNQQVLNHLGRTPKVAGFPEYIAEYSANPKDRADGRLMGLPYHTSQNVPSNLTKGSGTNLSALYFGNWSDLMIGEWGVMDMLVDPYTFSASGAIRIRCFVTCDVAVRYGGAFSQYVDVVTI